MNDLEELKFWLDKVNINYREWAAEEPIEPGDIDIAIFGGWPGMYTRFTFDKNGKFLKHGAFE